MVTSLRELRNKLSLLSLLIILITGCADNKQADKLPNIIVILGDDMGFGDIQVYNNNSKIPTPNLNTLGEQGLVFTDAHSNSAVCTPTRYGLLTGRYAWRTRLKAWVLSGYSNHLIDTATPTIASLAKSKGYHTSVIGKWHLGLDHNWKDGQQPKEANQLMYIPENDDIDYSVPVKNGPNDLGFDYSFIVSGSLDMGPYAYFENGKATAIPDGTHPFSDFPAYMREGEIAPDFSHADAQDKFTEKAVDYIEKRAEKDKPFLLYFPLTGPHKPALPAERFRGKSSLGAYGDMVMQVDWTVGKIIETLKKSGIEDNTLVIYTSDNGSYMYRINEGEPDHLIDETVEGFNPSKHQSNDRWRGTKADIYDGGHRVPFIVKWPKEVTRGSSSSEVICMTDIYSTIADIIGVNIKTEEGPDSYSFKSLLTEEEGFVQHPVIHHSVNGTFALRQGEWKMIFSDGSGGRQKPQGAPFQKPYQLYNLENDPLETNNLIHEHTEVSNQLEDLLNQIISNPLVKESIQSKSN